MFKLLSKCCVLLGLGITQLLFANATQTRPNVILVLTDDQGIGDLGCHGNPWIHTPNLDRFYQESLHLINFHVTPLCTPTRAGIMTGKYAIRNGAWATFKGRDILAQDHPVLPEIFKSAGYTTAHFGKWHLGDNYPCRPTDRGFDLSIQHLSGGVGELSDYWGNDYFDDTYRINNEPHSFQGYCTDIWFDAAIQFIKSHRDEPFFIYLATNAPHDPWIVDETYARPYREMAGKHYPSAEFYGMITNIDDNFAKLDQYLKSSGLDQNTIVIYMSDNGSSGGIDPRETMGWSMGFRGRKGSPYEAGHRVPFFIRWPQASIGGNIDLPDLASHVDILPTLMGLCGIHSDAYQNGDGIDLSNRLLGKTNVIPERTVFIHHRQDWRTPDPVKNSCVMSGDWRVVNGNELYNLSTDKNQRNNVADSHPEILKTLLTKNKNFLDSVKQENTYLNMPYASVGHDNQHAIVLTIQHAIGEDKGIWKTKHISEGKRNRNGTHMIHFEKSGIYKFSCCRWPREYPGPFLGVPRSNRNKALKELPISADSIRLKVGEMEQIHEIPEDTIEVTFQQTLPAGTFPVEAFIQDHGEEFGVYYLYIEPIHNNLAPASI